MSVVNPGVQTMGDNTVPEAEPWYSQHPYIALALAAGVAIVLLNIFMGQKKKASPPGTPANSADPQGLPTNSTDPNGNPIVYVPTTDTFLNYNYAANSYNSGQFAGNQGDIAGGVGNTTTTTSVVNNNDNEPGAPPPPVHTPPPPVHAPPPPTTKGSWTCRYTVVGGDNLTRIAEKYHTTWPAIYGHNITEINLIAAAMHFVIPGGAWNNIRPGEVLIVPCP